MFPSNNSKLNTGAIMKVAQKIFVTLLICFAISNSISAQNFNDALRLSEPGILGGAQALGMGNAYLALSNDFSATIFNPAGLGLIKQGEFKTDFNYNSFSNLGSLFNQGTKVNNNFSKLNQFGFVLPVPTRQGSLVFALGYSQVKSMNKTLSFNGFNSGNNSMIQDLTSFNNDMAYKLALSYPLYDKNNKYLRDTTIVRGNLNQSGDILQDGAINSWSFSGAIEIQKDVFVGTTINLYSGTFKKTRDYYERDTKNSYPNSVLLDPSEPASAGFESFHMKDLVDWDITGFDMNFGLLVKLNENFNVAATARLSKSFTVKENYTVSGESQFASKQYAVSPANDNLEYEITTPAEYAVGASYSKNHFTISGSVKMIDYTTMQFKSGFDKPILNDKNSDIVAMMKNVFNLNAGAEYVLADHGLSFRAGFMLMPSPFKNDPSDFDKKFATAGIGFFLNRSIKIDAAYAYGWWKDIADNYGTNLSRVYQDITTGDVIFSLKLLL